LPRTLRGVMEAECRRGKRQLKELKSTVDVKTKENSHQGGRDVIGEKVNGRDGLWGGKSEKRVLLVGKTQHLESNELGSKN